MADEPMTKDATVAALLRERDGYARRNMPDRVAQVDEQLALRGYSPPAPEPEPPAPEPEPPAPEPSEPEKPKGRRTPSKRTT